MTDIIRYNDTAIDFSADRLNMTHMWKATGSDPSKRPANWMRTAQAVELIDFLADTEKVSVAHLYSTSLGRSGITWGHWKVAMAYAKYLSLEFHNWCLEVVREKFDGKTTQSTMKDSALDKITKLEEHVSKLAARNRITEDQALDAVTLLWQQEFGIDLTKIPSLEYGKTVQLSSAGSVSLPPTDSSLFPFTALEAGEECKVLINEYRRLQRVVEGKRYGTALKSYGTPFAAILRDLKLHSHNAKGYVVTPAIKEASKAYCLEVPQIINTIENGVQKVRVTNIVKFNEAAISVVYDELTRRITDLMVRANTQTQLSVN